MRKPETSLHRDTAGVVGAGAESVDGPGASHPLSFRRMKRPSVSRRVGFG